jgi:alpha-beta hydrolase superfamily lysophospholipase
METTLSTDGGRATFTLSYLDVSDGVRLAVYEWPAPANPKAVVQITHGLAEHAARYDRLARALTDAGYAVFASDHRGHGKTARDETELGFFADDAGFKKLVADQFAVNRLIASRYPALPRVLLGHSFGSFVSQAYVFEHPQSIRALVLSGTTSANRFAVAPGIALARAIRMRLGTHGKSQILQQLSFGSYNDAFKPVRTEFDWLSRDPDEVDKYVADPLCGFDTTVQGWIDLLGGLLHIRSPQRQRHLPKDLPIYLLSGTTDPVGDMGKGPTRLSQQYIAAGLTRVKLNLYSSARHELFNETNRDQVTAELIAWLDGALGFTANPG